MLPRWRRLLTATVVLAAVLSFAGVAFGVGGTAHKVRVALPGAYAHDPLGARHLTFYSTNGWLRGAPMQNDGNLPALMQGLRRAGVKRVDTCCVDQIDFFTWGVAVMAREGGLASPQDPSTLGPHDVFLELHTQAPGDPPPCQRLSSGVGIYAELGNPFRTPFARSQFICPGRQPEIYGYHAGPAG